MTACNGKAMRNNHFLLLKDKNVLNICHRSKQKTNYNESKLNAPPLTLLKDERRYKNKEKQNAK